MLLESEKHVTIEVVLKNEPLLIFAKIFNLLLGKLIRSFKTCVEMKIIVAFLYLLLMSKNQGFGEEL